MFSYIKIEALDNGHLKGISFKYGYLFKYWVLPQDIEKIVEHEYMKSSWIEDGLDGVTSMNTCFKSIYVFYETKVQWLAFE